MSFRPKRCLTALATAALALSPCIARAQTGLRGEYYNFSGGGTCPADRAELFTPDNMVGFGLDSTIDFGNPFTLPGTTASNFGARWTGTLAVPTAGHYCFTTRSDDGIRLWIKDGTIDPTVDKPGIDRWENRGESGDDPPVCLDLQAAKKYSILIEYMQCGSGAAARLRYTPPGATSSVIVPPDLLSPPVGKDTIAPGQVTGLSVSDVTDTGATLGFTATGNDGATGTAHSYEIRYSTTPITPSNFYMGTSVPAPQPSAAGSAETGTISGLAPVTTYYVAIRAIDADLNAGALSNVATFTTTSTDANQGRISGHVVDRMGNPLPGTTVVVTAGGASTIVKADANGRYTALVQAGSVTANIDPMAAGTRAVNPAGATVQVTAGKDVTADVVGVVIPTLYLIPENGYKWLIYLDPSVDPYADYSAVNADESKFSVWNATSANGNWTEWLNQRGIPNANMDGWLRLHLTLPADWGTTFRGPLRLHGYNFNASDEALFNGTSVGELGKLVKDPGGPVRQDADAIRDYTVPESVVHWTGDNVIAIHGWHDAGSGGFTHAWPQLTVTTFVVPAALLGDLNADGKVDLKDATLSLQIAVGNLPGVTDAQKAADDVNKDNKFDLKDTTLILQAAVGLKPLM